MLKGRRTRKIVAVFLCLMMLTNIVGPTAAYALTSGPTAPEATSFEPVDTTDMVNLQTGDLTYNIPLLEVPGPEGGYPLSLSYHAGIQPNEDASWVGLGWTLNPGAIARNVNGYPDDWKEPTGQNHVYWAGGQTTTYNVGVSVGIANTPINVSFGLSFSSDTYRGFDIGASIGVGGGIRYGGSSIGIGVTIGVPPYGGDAYVNAYAGLNVGASVNGLNASAGIGISTNFESFNAGFSGGVGYSIPTRDGPMNFSLLGASISTGGDKPSFEVGGLSASVSSSSEAGIQTKSKSFGIDIPTPWGFNISLGWSKVRYWTDEKTNVYTHGGLYSSGYPVVDNRAYDTYALLEDPAEKNIINYPDPTKLQGGAFLDFDVYGVSGQGLGGNIRPYLLQGEVMGQNRKKSNGDPLTTYYSPGPNNYTPEFRFIGDFSNSYRQVYYNYWPSSVLRTETPPFDPNPVYGDFDGTYGYPGTGNKLAGSRYIEIGPAIKPSGAIGYYKYDRYQTGMIEGFSITNESGVTYHYGLPVYSWDEERFQKRIDESGGLAFNRGTKSTPYAYTWYLTTITGPDFVDRDGDESAGANDWGYWLNFEYGKWSNAYIWRNPSEGYQRDEDNEWQNCSMGVKEVYYLNAIKSRSHVALFEKDLRYDGKGASYTIFNKNSSNGIPTTYQNSGVYDIQSSQSMQLSKIYLLNAADASVVSAGASGTYYFEPNRPVPCPQCEESQNVLDRTDMVAVGRALIESKAIRVIDFEYDYSLCASTTNSFDIFGNTNSKTGKLTLKSMTMRGKGGICQLPPTNFEYELSGDQFVTATGSLSTSSFTTANPGFIAGDLLMTDDANKTYCGVITKKTPSGSNFIYDLKNSLFTGTNNNIAIRTTKNPPYNKDSYDMWGMYKSDFDVSLISSNPNLSGVTTTVSANGTDSWSLRFITTALGSTAKINYEPDTYRKIALSDKPTIIMKSISIQPDRKTLQFQIENYGYPITDFISIGTSYKGLLMVPYNEDEEIYILESNTWGWGDAYIRKLVFDYSQVGNLYINSINGNIITATLDMALPQAFTIYVTQFRRITYTYRNMILTGNIWTLPTSNNYGGGVRVSSITLAENTYSSTTKYDYLTPSLESSGVTTYLPTGFESFDISAAASEPGPPHGFGYINSYKEYKAALCKKINSLYSIAREIPPPGVMYEYVTVTSKIKNSNEAVARDIPGKTIYQFEVFRENMVGREAVATQLGNHQGENYTVKHLAIKKFTGAIGNVKKIIQYDKDGKKLTETINHYLHDGLEGLSFLGFMPQYKIRLSQIKYRYQGYLQERVSEVKEVQNSNELNGLKSTMSAREEYPVIPTGQTIINYVNGTKIKSETLGFDFYSGAITKTVETDANGNRFMTEVIPAYRKYNSMGLKNTNPTFKNMLTQKTATYRYKVDGNNNPLGLVSASVLTWSNNVDVLSNDYSTIIKQDNTQNGIIWRPKMEYSWMPEGITTDGLTAIGSFTNFDWINQDNPGAQNPGWKKTGEITLYNVFSKSLEAADMNGNYSAVKMGYKHSKVMMTVSPARYDEIAYYGFENKGANGIPDNNVVVILDVLPGETNNPVNVHTGSTSGAFANGDELYYSVQTNKLQSGRDYMASIWIKTSTVYQPTGSALYYQLDNGARIDGSITGKAGQWNLLTLKIPASAIASGTVLKVGSLHNGPPKVGTYYVDDYRFHPFDASVATYVYDNKSGELTYILDNNNIFTKFIYDVSGRLVKTYKEELPGGIRPLQSYSYNYGNKCSTHKWLSEELTGRFTRNNCPSGYAGTEVIYVVPAGTYSSTISQADADALAQIDLNTNGQNYANQYGFCDLVPVVYYNVVTSGVFIRNNCPPGQVGSSVTYTVPAGTYSSTISQADADAQAQADVNANGQNYANNNGTCTTPPTPCTFNVASGWSSAHPSLSSLSGVVTFNLDLLPTSLTSIYLNTPILVGNIGIFDLSCKPSVIRTVSNLIDNTVGIDNGRLWSLTFWPTGEVYLTLTTSPVNPFVLGPQDTPLNFSGTYNL